MFAGGRRRSSNVRAMQLFHELKQQFPTVPDHIVTACIAANASPSSSAPHTPEEKSNILQVLEAAASQQDPMGLAPAEQRTAVTAAALSQDKEEPRRDMTDNDVNHPSANYSKKDDRVDVTPSDAQLVGNSTFFVKRPTHLDIVPLNPRLQPSERCKDIHKLLNADKLEEKPPRSPQSRRLQTPPQSADGLVEGSVNFNLNVHMDVVRSPTQRRSSVLQLTPEQPWLQEPASPRSYTSVNLTLRPPSAEPQPPIDITSQNSSLTYSTSTFDSQKGLQSRLQITVGPGGGSVSSLRTRPRSSYYPEGEAVKAEGRTGSLPDLAANGDPPVVLKQQARIERLRIELNTEKAKLIVMKQEVADLENNQKRADQRKTDEELEKQLIREIQHLTCQCASASQTSEGFYRNIYTGQSLDLPLLQLQQPVRGRPQYQPPAAPPQPDTEGPKWNCDLCTFQNHPALNKCEQCDMPRILHGTPTLFPPQSTRCSYRNVPATPPAFNPQGGNAGGFLGLLGPRQTNNAYVMAPTAHQGRVFLQGTSERVSQI